ncbi:MAG: hypothetical protein ABID67_01200 [Candidatus Nealsonbacteria bacterium]
MLDIKEKKGISLIFVMLIISVILSISFGVSSILITQIKILRNIGYSVVSFYAADSGIENVLLVSPPVEIIETDLGNGATFRVEVVPGGEGECDPVLNYCIKSIGEYYEARRAIEIIY